MCIARAVAVLAMSTVLAAGPAAGPGLAASLAVSSGSPTAVSERLAADVLHWVARELGVEAPAMPRIVLGDPAALSGRDMAAHGGADRVVAVYLPQDRTIVLPAGWTGGSAVEVSMLVHEMVHHVETEAGARFGCAQAREEAAYRLQGAWLEAHGETLKGAFGLDRFTLFVLTRCGV